MLPSTSTLGTDVTCRARTVRTPLGVESYAKREAVCGLSLFFWFFLRLHFRYSPKEPPVRPRRTETTDSKTVPKQPTPAVLQADEGDRWMLLGDKPLIFKVDPTSTGSDALVVGTEEMPWGDYGRSDKRFTLEGCQLHALAVASRLLSTIPAMIKLKMTAANSSNQPQYWPGSRSTRMKWRP
jgi:hypothetical protein